MTIHFSFVELDYCIHDVLVDLNDILLIRRHSKQFNIYYCFHKGLKDFSPPVAIQVLLEFEHFPKYTNKLRLIFKHNAREL